MGISGAVESTPFYLRGNYAPVFEEVTAFDLPVVGAIPPQLKGRYLRNGPNPKSGESPHWFFGDGMVHGVELRDGKACWYRNRWVRTKQLEDGALAISPTGERDLTSGVANTHVIGHAGRIFALVESSFPTELDAELDTVGVCDFGGKLATPMTAHPKLCPVTGDLHFFGYDFLPPYLTYHRLDAKGELVQSEVIDVPGPTMMHDFAITEKYVLFMDLPVVFDLELAMRGTMPYRWSDEYGARVGVMPRGGRNQAVRWLDIEPCYVFHPLNAFEDGDEVVVDTARYESLWRDSPGTFNPATLHRWTLDLETGSVRERALDDRPIEFPRVDERRVGLRHRYGYAAYNEESVGAEFSGLLKYDTATGETTVHDFGQSQRPGEAVFVPAGGDAGEDEGWLMTYVYDRPSDSSELVILDASDIKSPPVARVRLPQRVPHGFHGSWVAEA